MKAKLKIILSIFICVMFSAVLVTTALLINNRNKRESFTPDIESDSSNGENGTQGGEDLNGPSVISTEEKVLLLIANADADIYNLFVYFIDSSGKIISEHVDVETNSEDYKLFCATLYNAINSEYSTADKLTNEMVSSSDNISNALDDLFEFFMTNMKE